MIDQFAKLSKRLRERGKLLDLYHPIIGGELDRLAADALDAQAVLEPAWRRLEEACKRDADPDMITDRSLLLYWARGTIDRQAAEIADAHAIADAFRETILKRDVEVLELQTALEAQAADMEEMNRLAREQDVTTPAGRAELLRWLRNESDWFGGAGTKRGKLFIMAANALDAQAVLEPAWRRLEEACKRDADPDMITDRSLLLYWARGTIDRQAAEIADAHAIADAFRETILKRDVEVLELQTALEAQAADIERLRKECRWRMKEMSRLARERDEAVETKHE